MPGALRRVHPAVSRNELGWLATLDDVESRLVFTDRSGAKVRYHSETGPFETERLMALPPRDWTLLVHDVEKHLPEMRKLLACVPFIPDWRIDDLMISFAAPGGSVGPHRDHYDVFLCQGIGVREWRITTANVGDDPAASDTLALTDEFAGEQQHATQNGDVLYLPPGVAHWGTAKRACMTYSIGMRAPRASDLTEATGTAPGDPFYADPDLDLREVRPGYISAQARRRARALLPAASADEASVLLGRGVTATKDWLRPEAPNAAEIAAILARPALIRALEVHGMARIAYDDRHAYANGDNRAITDAEREAMAHLCDQRGSGDCFCRENTSDLLAWLLQSGTFGIDLLP